MVFATVLIVILWLLQIVFLESFYKQIKIQSLKFNANSVVSSINSNDFANLLESVAKENNISVKIIDCSSFEVQKYVDHGDSGILGRLRDSELYIIYDAAKENGGQYFQHYQMVPLKNGSIPKGGESLPAVSQQSQGFPDEEFKRGAPPFFRSGSSFMEK